MRKAFVAILLTVAGAFAQTAARPAPPLEIVMPDGTKINTSRYAGKVCVVEFLFTTCPHCQQTASQLSQLYRELGPKGFQPIGAAFNEGAMMLVPQFVRDFGVNYPIGVVGRDAVLSYLQVPVTARLMVPQVVVIDKKGKIRHQSSIEGNEHLHDPARMRAIVQELLNEPAGGAAAAGNKKAKSKK